MDEHPSQPVPTTPGTPQASPEPAPAVTPPAKSAAPPANAPQSRKQVIRWLAAAVVLVGVGWFVTPRAIVWWNTVSTDDAYVDGHVTFVAPRVAGQISRVLVDDNYRVKKGDLLVQIDPEPFQVQVAIKKALVEVAESDLVAARAQVRAYAAQARAARYNLEHAIENVRNLVANLRSDVAQLNVQKANLNLTERDYQRNVSLYEKKVITQAEFDIFTAKRDEARSRVESASQIVQQTRANLGLAINLDEPLEVPKDIDQTFSLVRQAMYDMEKSISAFGYMPKSWTMTPKEVVEEFLKLDEEGNLDRIYEKLISTAPLIKQSEAKLMQAKRDLDQAELDLRYCDIVSEIDGVVTRRNVNAGNYVQVGQGLMAVRSLTEIWINANFKETQLADLRIGHRVRLEFDIYGTRHEYEGRITGFTMGTGQTLALLPPQNATGNFIKIVQRLPVRVELTDYDPEKFPLFVGLSAVPYVYYREQPEGPNAGQVLQPLATLPNMPAAIPTAASTSGAESPADRPATLSK